MQISRHLTYKIPKWVWTRNDWRSIPVKQELRGATVALSDLTIDWDDCPPRGAEVARRVREYMDSDGLLRAATRVEWRHSASRNGVHLDVWFMDSTFPAPGYTAYTWFSLRARLADDRARLNCDVWRYGRTGDHRYIRGVLWTTKFYEGTPRNAGRWNGLDERDWAEGHELRARVGSQSSPRFGRSNSASAGASTERPSEAL